ncbi:MAG: glycosyl hydrolase, partial [Clostridia bacterium]|nr:glycosyl hydrolase [Clostridia bacterium]
LGTKSVSMDNALKQIKENKATSKYEARFDLVKYSWNKNGKVYMLWMEDAMSIRNKVMLAKKYSLAGVASWRRGLESKDIWPAIKDEINTQR